MSKKEIQKDYKKRIKLINQYNDYYYDKINKFIFLRN